MSDGNRELVVVVAALALLVFALYAAARSAPSPMQQAIADPHWSQLLYQTNPGFPD